MLAAQVETQPERREGGARGAGGGGGDGGCDGGCGCGEGVVVDDVNGKSSVCLVKMWRLRCFSGAAVQAVPAVAELPNEWQCGANMAHFLCHKSSACHIWLLHGSSSFRCVVPPKKGEMRQKLNRCELNGSLRCYKMHLVFNNTHP